MNFDRVQGLYYNTILFIKSANKFVIHSNRVSSSTGHHSFTPPIPFTVFSMFDIGENLKVIIHCLERYPLTKWGVKSVIKVSRSVNFFTKGPFWSELIVLTHLSVLTKGKISLPLTWRTLIPWRCVDLLLHPVWNRFRSQGKSPFRYIKNWRRQVYTDEGFFFDDSRNVKMSPNYLRQKLHTHI